jgi:TRAP-type C4-dicarboxylate transport system permease small subunit
MCTSRMILRYFIPLFQLPSQESPCWWLLILVTLRHFLALCLIALALTFAFFIVMIVTDPEIWSGTNLPGDMHGFGWGIITACIFLYIVVPLVLITYLVQLVRLFKRYRNGKTADNKDESHIAIE